MLKFIANPGLKRELSGTAGTISNVISISAALYLIFAVLFYPAPILHRSIAFGLFYSVIFMGYASPGTKPGLRVPVFDWVLAALSLSVSIYIGLNFDRISSRLIFVDRVLLPDIIFGFLTIFLLIEGTRRVMGPWLPGLSLMALAYIFWGHHIPGRFGHLKFSMEYIMDGLFLSNYGIWGSTLGIAAGKVMVFLLFGTLFKNTGAGDFLFALVSRITGRVKGGVGKVAVISSALFGMLQGAALTNVTTTGAMTIPAMKRSGFKSEYAACVESCASVGGVFMPPIMGTVAFIMSDVVGIPYADLIKRAFIPAIIYFSALFFSVDFHSRKHGIGGIANETKGRIIPLLLSGYNFFIPLAFLIIRLMSGRPVAKAGLETIAVMLILGLLNRKKPLKFSTIVDTLKTTTSRGVMIVSTMAVCGILIGVIDITGITSKFSSYLIYVADVSVLATLVVIMLATLFLGLAMNTSSSYLIAAVLGAPVLIGLGFEPLGVHMFILFFAAMSTITPPVALTSYAAATIADASPMKVGFMSMKVGIVAYILPFIFVFNPAILLYGSFVEIAAVAVCAFIGTAVLAMGLEGWFFGMKTGFFIRLLLIIAGILAVFANIQLLLVSAVLTVFVAAVYIIKRIAWKRIAAEAEPNND